MKDIEIGDEVEVHMSYIIIYGIVEHMPGNTGDLWFIRDHRKVLRMINPNSSSLNEIRKVNKETVFRSSSVSLLPLIGCSGRNNK